MRKVIGGFLAAALMVCALGLSGCKKEEPAAPATPAQPAQPAPAAPANP